MDKVTLDFENNIVEWDTKSQKGTEYCPDLKERRTLILAAMGYSEYDFSNVINAINAFANGEATEEELTAFLENEVHEDGKKGDTEKNEKIQG